MRCPYCGDDVICHNDNGGYNLTYNYIDPLYPKFRHRILKRALIKIVDIS
jgi:hypothetical protein